jgi:ABC-type uncharacterized transport system permease subunit
VLDILLIVCEQAFLYFPLVLGSYISISLLKVPDLSIESAYVFGAICAARLVPHFTQLPLPVVLLSTVIVSLLGGLLVGSVVFLFARMFNVPHLLASVLTIGLFHGVNQFVLGTANFSLASFENPLACLNIIAVHPELLVLMGLFILLWIGGAFVLRTQLGYSFVIYGNNPSFFANFGISSKYVFGAGLLLANALAGLSGYCVAQSSSFVDINAGFGMALFSVTCLILGKALVRRRLFSVLIPVVGIFAYCLIQQMLLKVGFNLKYFTMIQSAIVLGILINQYRHGAVRKHKIDNLGV